MEDLAPATNFNSPGRVAPAHAITTLMVARSVDTQDDLHDGIGLRDSRAALRTVKGVGSKTVEYIGHIVGRSHMAVDVNLRAFAVDAGAVGSGREELQAASEESATAFGHGAGGLEQWRPVRPHRT
ncbi:hypothetical protein [Streptomyces sp. NPDC094468]|uniref:hypothetical protein n=1 Tax=Streptomyces sp. NPDC094468 TaxID=3366066 RepID=UPI003809B398